MIFALLSCAIRQFIFTPFYKWKMPKISSNIAFFSNYKYVFNCILRHTQHTIILLYVKLDFEPQAQFPKVLSFRTNISQGFLDTIPFSLDTWVRTSLISSQSWCTSASLSISNVYIDQRAIPGVWSEPVNEFGAHWLN